ncbi:MAG: hypothetical protein AAF656_14315 [Planctomycetota bacterium]
MSYRERKSRSNRQHSAILRFLHEEHHLHKQFIRTATRLTEAELDDVLAGGVLETELERHVVKTLCGAVDLSVSEVRYETAVREARPVKPEYEEASALIMDFLRSGAEHEQRLRLERRARDAG